MAKKKKIETDAGELPAPVEGTVEYERQRHFEEQKAGYEARTGEKVIYELDAPLTSTPLSPPIDEDQTDESAADDSTENEDPAEGDG
jgi:hypothetical protein